MYGIKNTADRLDPPFVIGHEILLTLLDSL